MPALMTDTPLQHPDVSQGRLSRKGGSRGPRNVRQGVVLVAIHDKPSCLSAALKATCFGSPAPTRERADKISDSLPCSNPGARILASHQPKPATQILNSKP
mmetsp:Transcript_7771/g.12366  ORF Transcript_7771/g.12366 Transcript_7771/m.12366 type:complete len:101 (+) Transcript_7771:786-1088(+)